MESHIHFILMFWRHQFCLQTSASEVIVMLETSNQAAREICPKRRQQRTFWKFCHKFLRDTVYISILKRYVFNISYFDKYTGYLTALMSV